MGDEVSILAEVVPVVDDADLIVSSVERPDAFGELYERHAEALLAFFSRRTACPQTAADLTAETFAQAFASRGRFRRSGAPARSWLFTIARRQLSRYVRSEIVSAKYRDKLGLPEQTLMTDTDVEWIARLFDDDPDRATLLAALDTLTEGQRVAVQLRVVNELPYPEVAQYLGCTEQAARVRVCRGLTDLRAYLKLDNDTNGVPK